MARLFQRGNIWWLGYRIPGKAHEQRESCETEKEQEARVILRKRLASLFFISANPVQENEVTVTELLDGLQDDYRMQGRKSLADTQYHLKPLYSSLGNLKAPTVTTETLRVYVRARQQLGLAPGTINRELAALRRAFNLAQMAGSVDRVPKFPLLKETGLRQGTFTKKEIDRLMAELPVHLKPILMFAYLTGRRRGEILQILWEDVNLPGQWIQIRASTTKTGSPDRIPLTGELLDLMLDLARETDINVPWVFHYNNKPLKGFQQTWKAALARAGLKDKLFHDLRRTVATDLIEAGVPEQVAMAVTGHKTRSVFQRYHIVRTGAVRDALATLENFRNGEKV